MSRARAASAIATASAAVAMSTAAHSSAKSSIGYAPVRRTGAPAHGRSQRNSVPSPLQPHATSTGVTDRAFADQFDARGRKRVDKLHQRIDISPDNPLARLHALDRGQRETRALGEFALIDLQQRACGPHLSSGYHVLDIRIDISYIAIHA